MKISILSLIILLSFPALSQDITLEKVKYKYPNRKIKAKGTVGERGFGFRYSNQKFGLWEFYYEDGTPQEISNWKKDSKHGSFVSYHPNGKLKAKGTYHEGRRKGYWQFFYENGQKELSCYFRDYTGSKYFESFYENGATKYRGYVSRSKVDAESNSSDYYYKEGEWKEYYENGRLKSIGNFKKPTSDGYLLSGFMSVIKDDGQLRFTRQGLWKFYHPNGRLESEGFFMDNHKTKKWKYYSNDSRLIRESFEDGKSAKSLLFPKGRSDVNLKNAMKHAYSGYLINDPEATYYMARNYFEGITIKQNNEMGLKLLEKAYNSHSSGSAEYKGQIEDGNKNYEKAIAYYKQAIEWDNTNSTARYNLVARLYNKFVAINNQESPLTDDDVKEILILLKGAQTHLAEYIKLVGDKDVAELKLKIEKYISEYSK
jgi:antitoxin component YwqK of YwqJK toxin-antitoxin module